MCATWGSNKIDCFSLGPLILQILTLPVEVTNKACPQRLWKSWMQTLHSGSLSHLYHSQSWKDLLPSVRMYYTLQCTKEKSHNWCTGMPHWWLKTRSADLLWYTIAGLPTYFSTIVSAGTHLIGVGGTLASKQRDIYAYSLSKDEWKVVSQMTTPCSSYIATISDINELLVLGGSMDEGPSNIVEAAEITVK